MKRALTLAAILASISGCATGGGGAGMRREAAATASPDASRPGESAVGPNAVAISGEGTFARPSVFSLDGRVAEVAGTPHKAVLIQRQGKDARELRVDDDTRVLRDGRKVGLDDVREGDEVRATFEVRGDTATATELRVVPGATSK